MMPHHMPTAAARPLLRRSQAFSDPSKQQYMASQKTMEINPRHPILRGLLNLVEEDPESEALKDAAWLLYDTALLQSGFAQDDVDAFAGRMFRTMKSALKIDSLDLEDEIEVPEEEEEEEEEEDGGPEEVSDSASSGEL